MSIRGAWEKQSVSEISELEFDQNHIHLLCRFLPKYSVARLIKSMTAKQVFAAVPEVMKKLWGGEFLD